MKVYEVLAGSELPPGSAGMVMLAKALTMQYRTLAKKFGLTIDGDTGPGSNILPRARVGYILFGGYLVPQGGIRSEEVRSESFEYRVEEFLKELHKTLMQLQVRGLNGDLEYNYQIYIGHAIDTKGLGMLKPEVCSASNWFHREVVWPAPNSTPNHRGGYKSCLATWMMVRT